MRWIVAVATAFALLAGPASAADVERVDLVTHVFPETGHRVVSVAVRYDGPVSPRGTSFSVTATIDGVTAPRTVTGVSSGPDRRSLIVALDPADANAGVNGNSADGATAPRNLVGAYSVTQAGQPFTYENDGVLNPVVDDFERRSFTDAAGTRLAFRLYRPKPSRERKVPLVLVLHGGGETGSPQVTPANTTNITANRSAIVWATRREQAYVVAPQLPGRLSQWTEPAIQANVMALVDQLAKRYPIDRDRIYLTGLSRGARGAIEFLANNPRTFAGALLAAARAENDDVSEVAKFARVPIWFTHAADDPVVPYQGSVDLAAALEAAGTRVVRGEWAGDNSAGPAQDRAAEAAARRLLQRARGASLFTTYTPGTVAVNPHFSWGPTYETDVMLDWLFATSR
ncbi:alpha/beta hydrolase-fold protein [Solirubrobacter taibaiensis]|nr:alpha/beta hydrolase-fold protein [Solirubrobacter taibaiensis]